MVLDAEDIETAVGQTAPLEAPEDAPVQVAGSAASRRRSVQQLQDGKRSRHVYTHCSALVKLTPGNADLIVGHDTWSHYSTMLRVFKLYILPLRASTGSTSVHMSSYPGYIWSTDDWYQLAPSLLTVTETTNDIWNSALYALVQPGSVSIWARTLIANRMASNGNEWAELFARYNNGVCNNQVRLAASIRSSARECCARVPQSGFIACIFSCSSLPARLSCTVDRAGSQAIRSRRRAADAWLADDR
jgi:hypothetical protein